MVNLTKSALLLTLAGTFVAAACTTAKEAPPVQTTGFKPGKDHVRKDVDGKKIKVEVAVADNAVILDPGKTLPLTLMAMITNKDGVKNEKVYGFKPKNEATYYLYVESSPTPRWSMLEVGKDGVPVPFHEGALIDCHDGHSSSVAEVGFKDCGARTVSTPLPINRSGLVETSLIRGAYRAVLALFRPASLQSPPDEEPAWIACVDGCCTAGG